MDRERLKTLAEQVAVDFPRGQDRAAYIAEAHPQAILALLAELERAEVERDAANHTLMIHAEQVLRLGQILKPLGYEKGTTFDEIARDFVTTKAENARLREALVGLKRVYCFCDCANVKPQFGFGGRHTSACLNASAALASSTSGRIGGASK